MLVDDDADTNFYNEIILTDAEVTNHIITFQNGNDALEYLKKGDNVDLILLDINMPIINGWQFLESYEKMDKNLHAKIIVVMLTSSVNFDDEKKAETFNSVKKFINKPMNRKTINEIIHLFDEK